MTNEAIRKYILNTLADLIITNKYIAQPITPSEHKNKTKFKLVNITNRN